ncbi:MAG: hypothetical protein JNJ54_34650 [Myxococcaceae bacterium]|nr:hypothetical protein [Myxococcaceae bacterium]
MTTSEPTASGPGAWARAENASRRVLLVLCLGLLAWGVGALLAVNLRELLEDTLDRTVETGLGAIVEHWVFQRFWVVFVFAPVCWVAGRFLGGSSLLFVVPGFLTGEAFALALGFLRDGSPFHSWADVAGWAISIVLSLPICFVAFISGGRAFERAQARSLVDAAARKADYDAFIAKANQGAEPPPNPPTEPRS